MLVCKAGFFIILPIAVTKILINGLISTSHDAVGKHGAGFCKSGIFASAFFGLLPFFDAYFAHILGVPFAHQYR